MNWIGSGFISVLIYQTYQQGSESLTAITTESGQNILTESSQTLQTES